MWRLRNSSFPANLVTVISLFLMGTYAQSAEFVNYPSGERQGQALLCRPTGKGPFATVVYNHAVIVDNQGYNRAKARGYHMDKICDALAADGFLVFAPIRQSGSRNIPGLKEEVSVAVDYVKSLPDVDSSRIALMGLSRGGALTLMVAVERKDLKGVAIQAPAPAGGQFAQAIERVGSINAPVLLVVEQSDDQIDLADVEKLEKALRAHGKDVRSIRYTKGGGHLLFRDVDYYWDDLRTFLREKLR